MTATEIVADRLLALCDEALAGRADCEEVDALCAKVGPSLMAQAQMAKRGALA